MRTLPGIPLFLAVSPARFRGFCVLGGISGSGGVWD